MFSQALRDIARPTYAEILEALKRSDGMAVSELAKQLQMSYMGVKQHCVNLEPPDQENNKEKVQLIWSTVYFRNQDCFLNS